MKPHALARTSLLAAALAASALLPGCSGGSGSGVTWIRFVDAAQDAGSLEVLVDGQVQSSGLRFLNASAWISADTDTHIQIALSSAPTVFLVDTTISHGEDVKYLYAIIDPPGGPTLDVRMVTAFESPPSGRALVCFANEAPDEPALELVSATAGISLQSAFDVSTSCDDAPPGTHDFEVRHVGSGTAIYTNPAIDLASGEEQVFLAVGRESDASFRTLRVIEGP